MRRNPKSANKISHEYNEFAGIGGREWFTCSGAPSGGCLIVQDAFEHHSFQDLLGGHRFDPFLVAADLIRTLRHLPPWLLWARATAFLPALRHGSDLIRFGCDFNCGDATVAAIAVCEKAKHRVLYGCEEKGVLMRNEESVPPWVD